MIKIVVTGSGYWGKNLVRNFHALGALAAICDKDLRILQNLQEMYDGVATFQRFDDLLYGSGPSVEAIAMATQIEFEWLGKRTYCQMQVLNLRRVNE